MKLLKRTDLLLILSLTIGTTLLSSFNFKADDKVEGTIREKYRVTATTKNSYGKNEWIDLIIEADVTSYSKYIYDVYYDDGYGLKRLSKYVDYNYENTYYVLINSKQFYFTF
jgi:hypothetical protein